MELRSLGIGSVFEKLVDRGLSARLMVHLLDNDHAAVASSRPSVAQGLSWHGSQNHPGVRRHLAAKALALGAVHNFGASAGEDKHAEHRALVHHVALHDLQAWDL